MISSPQAELQKLIYDTLKADADVMALASDVYDAVPPKPWTNPKNGYISFGPADAINDDAECIVSATHTLQIDCWSRQVGAVHCKRMVDAVYAALHDSDLILSDNALGSMVVILRQVMGDPDGLTTHGIVQVSAEIEEANGTTLPFYVLADGYWEDAAPWADNQPWKDGP